MFFFRNCDVATYFGAEIDPYQVSIVSYINENWEYFN